MKNVLIHEIKYFKDYSVREERSVDKAIVLFSLGKIINCKIEMPGEKATSHKEVLDYIHKELEDVLEMRYIDEV